MERETAVALALNFGIILLHATASPESLARETASAMEHIRVVIGSADIPASIRSPIMNAYGFLDGNLADNLREEDLTMIRLACTTVTDALKLMG